jgi:hypothetical protein
MGKELLPMEFYNDHPDLSPISALEPMTETESLQDERILVIQEELEKKKQEQLLMDEWKRQGIWDDPAPYWYELKSKEFNQHLQMNNFNLMYQGN